MLGDHASDVKWLIRFFALLLLPAVCAACGGKSQDRILDFRDKIEDAAGSLQYSQKTEAVVDQRLDAEKPWFLLFIPSTGLEEKSAQALPEDAKKSIKLRLPSWTGHAVVVYSMPRAMSITSLPDNVRLSRQIVLRGETGSTNLVAKLLKSNDAVWLDSVSAR